MTNVAVYTSIYGATDEAHPQPVPYQLYREDNAPLALPYSPRLAAKFWRMHPEIACPGADVTIWIDGSITVLRPDLAELTLDALGDTDAAFIRHPSRDDIYAEAALAIEMDKYPGQPIEPQVHHYRTEGHPEHWGLWATGVLIRRTNDRMVALNAAWWAEILRWTHMDQLSLPPLLRTRELSYVTLPAAHLWGAATRAASGYGMDNLPPAEEWFCLHRHRGDNGWITS